MKWADKIDLRERGRASDEVVAPLLSPWARSNIELSTDGTPDRDCGCTAGTICRHNAACPRLARDVSER